MYHCHFAYLFIFLASSDIKLVIRYFSTLTRGIGRGLKSKKNMINPAAFLLMSQVMSLWPLLSCMVVNLSLLGINKGNSSIPMFNTHISIEKTKP